MHICTFISSILSERDVTCIWHHFYRSYHGLSFFLTIYSYNEMVLQMEFVCHTKDLLLAFFWLFIVDLSIILYHQNHDGTTDKASWQVLGNLRGEGKWLVINLIRKTWYSYSPLPRDSTSTFDTEHSVSFFVNLPTLDFDFGIFVV